MPDEIRLCALESCRKPLVRGEKEPTTSWKRRVTCDLVCGKKYAARYWHERYERIIAEHSPCANPACGKQFLPHQDETGKRIEEPQDYKARRYCSVSCRASMRSKRRKWRPAKAQPKSGPRKPAPVPRPSLAPAAVESVEEFQKRGGVVTVLPPAFAGIVRSGLSEAEARRRIRDLVLPAAPTKWSNAGIFGGRGK